MFDRTDSEIGCGRSVTEDGQGGCILRLAGSLFLSPNLGDSIAIDGVCLTVVEHTSASLTFQAGPETFHRTTLGRLAKGDRVNLEPALRVGDPLGGHFVSGHVDCVGTIAEVIENGEWRTYRFDLSAEFDDLLVMKGSIAVDGISLTLAEVTSGRFGVMVIPHTLANTTLGTKSVGAPVNLEFDLIAKHVRKLFKTLTVTI